MANILYRGSATPTATNTAGNNNAPLTNDQIDKNFYALDSAKFEKTGGTITGSLNVTGSITTTAGTVITTGDTGTVTNAMLAGSISTSKITGLATSATTDTTNAGNISSGTLSASRLPAFTGDATSTAGTSALTLANTAVTAGSYGSSSAVPVITVDSKGRITAASTASISGSITIAGDATGSGSTGSTTTITLATVNSSPGSGFNTFTVDGKGRVTSASAAVTATTGTFSGAITSAGDITAYYSSDARLKTNVQLIPNALTKLTLVDGVTFNWNQLALDKDTNVREPGVIAQQIKEVLPEAVTTRDNGYLAVRYEKLVPLLIQAIKELNTKVEDLKNQLASK